jgi:diguanylate cyclase (GGDEF)-like protein
MPTSTTVPSLLMQYADLSDNGIALLDSDDRFLYYNKTIAQMFGLEDQSMYCKTHRDLMAWMYIQKRGVSIINWPSVEDWLDHVRGRHRSSEFRSLEVDLVDGRWILMTEQICPGGELVMFCSDITRRKEAELALRKAHGDIERLALIDDLTGVPNRRNFMQQLEQELSRSTRNSRPLCLAMLDLDYFKLVNDRFGHAAGDAVLRHFAHFLLHQLRVGDVVGRLGGEEFAVMLPDTNMTDALQVLNRVVARLRLERLCSVAPDFNYAFSGGLVQRDANPIDASSFLARADRALYQAKSDGRDRMVGAVIHS